MRKALLLAITFSLLLANFFIPPTAEAGVLLRGRRITAQLNSRPPRMSFMKVHKSTYAAARTQPSFGSKNYDLEIDKIKRSELKYQEKYERWYQKQVEKLQRKRDKEERIQDKIAFEFKKKRDEMFKKAKKLAKAEELAKAEKSGSGGISSFFGGSSSSSASKVLDKDGQAPKKRVSIWTHFWRALFGT